MLRTDLAAAGIPYRDEAGRVFDFHALRHQFISNLARAGAHPKQAQTLARHSTITLTMDRYTHLGMYDMVAALGKLPAIPPAGGECETAVARATGTAGPGSAAEVPTVVPRVPKMVPFCLHRLRCGSRQIAPTGSGKRSGKRKTPSPQIGNGVRRYAPTCANSHRSALRCVPDQGKRGRRDSNPQPPDRQSGTLTN